MNYSCFYFLRKKDYFGMMKRMIFLLLLRFMLIFKKGCFMGKIIAIANQKGGVGVRP